MLLFYMYILINFICIVFYAIFVIQTVEYYFYY